MSPARWRPCSRSARLRAAYGKIEALKGVDLDVHAGEIVTLIGANGAGKSTLMMTICGNPRARAGRIVFDGHDITDVPTHEIARLRHRAVAGRPPHLPAHDRDGEPADGRRRDRRSESDRASGLERVFTLFPRLKERLTQRGGTLSGGEQQMLAIGRALMSRPRLLLLDEPSLGLAPLIARQIFDAIRDAEPHEDGLTVLLVEQNAFHALQARASRLCHGQRPDHPGGHRQRTAGAAGDPRCLSRRRPAGVTLPAPGGAAARCGERTVFCPKIADDFAVKSADNSVIFVPGLPGASRNRPTREDTA